MKSHLWGMHSSDLGLQDIISCSGHDCSSAPGSSLVAASNESDDPSWQSVPCANLGGHTKGPFCWHILPFLLWEHTHIISGKHLKGHHYAKVTFPVAWGVQASTNSSAPHYSLLLTWSIFSFIKWKKKKPFSFCMSSVGYQVIKKVT